MCYRNVSVCLSVCHTRGYTVLTVPNGNKVTTKHQLELMYVLFHGITTSDLEPLLSLNHLFWTSSYVSRGRCILKFNT